MNKQSEITFSHYKPDKKHFNILLKKYKDAPLEQKKQILIEILIFLNRDNCEPYQPYLPHREMSVSDLKKYAKSRLSE
jgi:hypothetical protein